MPGNPVKKRPQSDLVNQIPSDWSPELQKAYDKALKDYKAQMPAGDVLDYVRTPFNVMGNSMAGLGAEMLGKGKQFEAKYGWMPKTQAEMDAVETMMKYMEPAIETMDRLKVPPIVGPNTPTVAAAIQGVDRAAARLTAEQAARAAANAGQAVKKAATSDDLAYAIENLAQKAGFGPKQIMMGPTSKTWNHGNAALAKHMELQGENPEAIWKATGTFRGPDDLWRQEIPDVNMKYSVSPVRSRQYETDRKRYSQAIDKATTQEELQAAQKYYEKQRGKNSLNFIGKAQEFIEHPELFQAYPELANYAFRELEPTHKKFTAPQNAYGFYSPGQKTITVNTDAPLRRSTALHELQHAIQEIEGWQGGSSPQEMAARLADREIAKTREMDLLQSIEDMQKTLPPSANNLILTEGQKLKNIQDFLKQTRRLEGERDPYNAYRRVSGEEEARMVQARQPYSEEKLAERPPFEDYETDPSYHITEFAAGGEVHMAGGGFLDMMAKAAKEGVSRTQRLAMSNKDVARRIPALEEAIAALERGEITKQQYAQLVQAYKPVAPYETFFNPEPDEKIIGALTKTNREKEGTRPKQSYFGVPSSTLKRGDKAATRQDIPSYTEADTWVVTAHQPQQGKRVYAGAGPRIGYEPVAMLNDVRFEVQPNAAMKIAKGGQKGTIATMEGYWEPITRELAEEMGPELMRDPRWVQAGMDPTRSASFYNRETMQPIVEGEQVLHSGPLVLVKNPMYGDIEDFPFKEGGAVTMAKGGILGALAKTAEAGVERAAKTAKAMQQVLPVIERDANLAKFLEPSKVKDRLYHGTRTSFNQFKHGEGKDTDFGRFGQGYYFTPDADLASAYTRNETGGNVMPVFLSIKNPYMFKGSESQELLRKLGGGPEPKNMFSEEGKQWAESVREGLEGMGYDGYMDATDPKYAKEIVAFHPNQIKSALGNRGTYDIEDLDINKADGGDVTIEEFLKRMKAK